MLTFYPYFVFIHIISGGMYVVTMIIMQLVVANMMRRIPAGEGKRAAVYFLRTHWHPVVDTVIILVGISGGYIAWFNWQMVIGNGALQLKLGAGALSLSAAYLNHFFFRYLKRNLAASGRNPALLRRANFITPLLDKCALGFGVTAALLGVGMNHL